MSENNDKSLHIVTFLIIVLMGYILLELLLTVCCVIGIMLPIQTLFQIKAGISLPIGAIVTKVAIFIILAIFALYFNIKFLKNMK